MATASIANDPCSVFPLVDVISECISAAGTADFTDCFLHMLRMTGAGHVTAFIYQPRYATCFVNRNLMSEDDRDTLATAYIAGRFREDPLFETAMAMADGTCIVERLENLLPRINSRYLSMFFGDAGFRTKVSVLVAQQSLRLVLNLYFEGNFDRESCRSPLTLDDAVYRLVGRTLARHVSWPSSHECQRPLAVLSERERQVCVGILAGKKAEIIAEEVGVRRSSVVTYRQRAYQKLGISSRGELFSMCHAWPKRQQPRH